MPLFTGGLNLWTSWFSVFLDCCLCLAASGSVRTASVPLGPTEGFDIGDHVMLTTAN